MALDVIGHDAAAEFVLVAVEEDMKDGQLPIRKPSDE